jgi:hypothetical protein
MVPQNFERIGGVMFNVGDVVRNVAANIVGEVVEIDGDTVYIEQDNGAEVDFQLATLVLESAFQAKHGGAVKKDVGSHAYDATYQAVIDNLYPAMLEVGHVAHANTTPVPGINPKRWEELSALQKLNLISDATDTPVKLWIDASKHGAKPSLATLQLSLLGAYQKGKK